MLIPSIDIISGRAVQLRGGKQQILTALEDPVQLAKRFNRFGEVAIIDLDAALGSGDNTDLIKQICRVVDARVGGGIRTVSKGEEYLRAGAKKIIIGTKATPEFLSNFPASKVQVALDHINQEVLDKGWQNSTGESIAERASELSDYCDSFLITFVDREGSMKGLYPDAVKPALDGISNRITLAGGIKDTENSVALLKLGYDVQVGMALYTDVLDPQKAFVDSMDWQKQKLMPTIVQDEFGQVVMLAYSSSESLELALKKGKGIYHSRSRNELWEKGKTSGNPQDLLSCRWDCDRDSLVFKVKQAGFACHKGSYSCFGERDFSLFYLYSILQARKEILPDNSYSAKLFKSPHAINEKLQEEISEVLSAPDRENLVWELADLMYFLLMKGVSEGIEFGEIIAELERRNK